MSSPDNILESSFYKKAESRAKQVAGDKEKSFSLIERALDKLKSLASVPGKLRDIKDDLFLFFGMLKAYYQGKYRNVPIGAIIKMLSAIIYFLFIVDFVPDFIPFIGLLDDVAVFAWVLKSVKGELEKFKKWQERQQTTG